jgi:outer membrane receptor protein involved in Fe transport
MIFKIVICATVLAASTAASVAQQSSPQGQSPGDVRQNPSQGSPPAGTSAAPPAGQLPPVKVITAPPKQTPARPKVRESSRGSAPSARAPSVTTGAANTPAGSANSEASPVTTEARALDSARDNSILPKIGANTYQIGRQQIEASPQGDNAPLDKVLLQAPGVTQDSAASGQIHIRNEHANVQYRINGILLPDGVAGFSQVLETNFIGGVAVVTGALPAQYGLHTAGLVDITTRTTQEPSGSVSIYGGSHGTITPSFQYGGTSGNTEYFFTGRYFESGLGIENPTSSYDAIHDDTRQEKFFSYVSTVLPGNARWTMITGASVSHYQIPNNPGQDPFPSLPSKNFTPLSNSANLNEQQLEQNYYGVLAFQKSTADADYQISYFSRYSSVHFTPDTIGDLTFNGVASNVSRHSFVNGIQGDSAFRVSPDHTLRAGFTVSGEQTYVTNSSVAFSTDPANPIGTLETVNDRNSKLGWIIGTYLQDEWKITNKLALNTGVRFDQMYQYVDANQISPRVSLVYKPLESTVFHAGYARNFTPPEQVIAAPVAFHKLDNTTAAADPTSEAQNQPVKPERSHVFDVGVTHQVLPGFEVGVDAYYKIARNLLDDGQFGAAYVLSGFNYDQGENEGIEFTAKYRLGGFMAYGNLAYARQVGKEIVSNQYLFGQDEIDFIRNHFIYTDHAQRVTASAGASYKWDDTTYSVNAIYGSGLRTGNFNSDHLPGYTQVNLGVAHEFTLPNWKPFTMRFDVVNVFDEIYEIRDGSGIGVFAPQFGPRRGYFVGYSQKF